MYSVIISHGRVADRTAGAMAGALRAGEALADLTGVSPVVVGRPSAPQDDDWSVSLPHAEQQIRDVRTELVHALDQGRVPILATNTCAVSLATLPTVAVREPDALVLWIDAHGDFNTPNTTESGYLGGMVLAAACDQWDSGHGGGLDPSRVIVVGARDIDPAERELMERAGVRVLDPERATPERVLDLVAGRPVWIHVDWDVLEPGYIPAEYRVDGGLRPHELAQIFAALPMDSVRGIELAEYNLDDTGVPEALSLELILETVGYLLAPRHLR